MRCDTVLHERSTIPRMLRALIASSRATTALVTTAWGWAVVEAAASRRTQVCALSSSAAALVCVVIDCTGQAAGLGRTTGLASAPDAARVHEIMARQHISRVHSQSLPFGCRSREGGAPVRVRC